jgi:cobalt-precorrin 5A hydrolase / precorrin-3B C17-methyltransferase
MKCAVITLTKRGTTLGRKLQKALPDCDIYVPRKFGSGNGEQLYDEPIGELMARLFGEYANFIMITAVAVAVRSVAPYLNGKTRDPGLVAVDERGHYAVSVLGGHARESNKLARRVAFLLEGQPVVTTASEVSETLPLDLIGQRFGWTLENREAAAAVSAALINGAPLGIYQDQGETDWGRDRLPPSATIFDSVEALAKAGTDGALIISDRVLSDAELAALPPTMIYRPRSLVLGIGFNTGTDVAEMAQAVNALLAENSLAAASLFAIATIEAKRDDPALVALAERLDLPLQYFSAGELSEVPTPTPPSAVVARAVGSPAVAEPAALLSSGGVIVVPKVKTGNVTLSLARRGFPAQGKLYIVGTGPGDGDQLTVHARDVLRECDTVIGYRSYLKYIRHLLPGKDLRSSEMRQETNRAAQALELARQGRRVALVSGGDPGVYGMSAAVHEMVNGNGLDVPVEVVPGVPAICAAAARLGAPLSGDFAAVSLSDLLTPWPDIEKRLAHAAEAEFIMAIYNPRSKGRRRHLDRAREIILMYRPPETLVALVRNAYRSGEETITITDLEHMPEYPVDMFTLVMIGNRETRRLPDGLLTPRGYRRKYAP